jgi:hypothetical protein
VCEMLADVLDGRYEVAILSTSFLFYRAQTYFAEASPEQKRQGKPAISRQVLRGGGLGVKDYSDPGMTESCHISPLSIAARRRPLSSRVESRSAWLIFLSRFSPSRKSLMCCGGWYLHWT